jgi:hypothetical protein
MELRRKCSCVTSQDTGSAIFDDMDYVGFMRELAKRRGDECGRPWAEGFREVKTYPTLGSWELLPAFIPAPLDGPE